MLAAEPWTEQDAIGKRAMIPDALTEGREALRLDELTPHADKKLDPEVRKWLKGKIPIWEKAQADSQRLRWPFCPHVKGP